jgi:putative flippase GtrA
MTRFVRFNVVGVLGFAVQLAVLLALERAGWPVVAATIVAVEAAVLHNFIWHERWTWRLPRRSRRRDARRGSWRGRLARFQVTNGLISLAGNTIVTGAMVQACVPVAIASICAVLVCAAANFAAAKLFVFCDKTWPNLRWAPSTSSPPAVRGFSSDRS